jgi:transposase
MRSIKEVLRLRHQHQLSVREIARSCGLPVSTVGDYLKRAATAQITWPLSDELDEVQLQERLLASPPSEAPASPASAKAAPDWAAVHEQLRRKGVTLQLLWQEYRQAQPDGYRYSRFCELYRAWAATLDPVLRQVHVPGEKLFVDWAGQTVPIHDPGSAEVTEAHLFVAVLGASNRTYVEAFADEKLESWIAAHCHAYAFFGGVARITVPDNPKTAVQRPCRYEPLLHRTYQEMAEHYGTVIVPARIRKPRDKAKVETGVQIVERQILAVLRDRRFFGVGALNDAMRPLLARLNAQPFQKLEGSRDEWFERHERDRLLPLPATVFEVATWSSAGVNIDYHAVVDHHYYSVPHTLIHQRVDVRLTGTTVELFHAGKRVAVHPRSHRRGLHTTLEEHRPKAHQRFLEWTPGRIVQWAQSIGPNCARLVERVMAERPHPEQGYRSCLGIIRLAKGAGTARLEAACIRALHHGTCSYRSVQSILENHLDRQPLEQELPLPSPAHANLRGSPYYS